MQPLASLEALADPIYEAFYGLKEQPFAISTDPKFLFMSASHERALEELVSGLRRQESMLLLTGETGTGKTTICRAVLGSLGERTFSALILNPYMSGAEMLRAILRDFGFVSRDDLRRGAFAQADVPQLLDALEGFLASIRSLDSHAVVVIDEAQSLPADVLDQIRLLTAHERDGHRLIQVVLVGQPLLLETLKTEPMYALNERVTRRVTLMPLPPADVAAYIKHRLEVAGGTAVTFAPEAADAGGRAVARPAAARQRPVRPRAAGRADQGRVDHHAGDGQAGGAVACERARRARARSERGRRAEREGRARDPAHVLAIGILALAASRGGRGCRPRDRGRARLRLLRARRRVGWPGHSRAAGRAQARSPPGDDHSRAR